MIDLEMGGGGPELRDCPFWKTAENWKISQSVRAKIVHFAYWPICVLETVYVEGFFKVSF
jgi:hypothetical protein